MIFFPAIDLKDGQCVRLFQGDMDQVTVFGDDPAGQAKGFADAGAKWLHVVDLNGAFSGRPVNEDAVSGILDRIDIPVQLGGGIRDMQTIDFSRLLSQEPAEIEKLVCCCQTEGFFYIDLQGIDGRRVLDDQQSTFQLMNRFFESPLEVKNKYGLVSPHLG